MARAMVILLFLWVVNLAAYLALRTLPKDSPLRGLRDMVGMLLLAASIVGVLLLVGLVTGLITVGETPFGSSKPAP